jgi:hypothetical protein
LFEEAIWGFLKWGIPKIKGFKTKLVGGNPILGNLHIVNIDYVSAEAFSICNIMCCWKFHRFLFNGLNNVGKIPGPGNKKLLKSARFLNASVGFGGSCFQKAHPVAVTVFGNDMTDIGHGSKCKAPTRTLDPHAIHSRDAYPYTSPRI